MIYLACPYSHPDLNVRQERFMVANRVAAKFMDAGQHVFSPLSHSHPIACAGDLPTSWEYWEEHDRKIMAACESVLVIRLPGWDNSVGVRAEMGIAEELGLPVEFYDPF